jgi:hypothetical protein
VDAPRRPRTGKKPKANVEENEANHEAQEGAQPIEIDQIETDSAFGEYGFLGQALQEQLMQQRQSTQQFRVIHQQLTQQAQQPQQQAQSHPPPSQPSLLQHLLPSQPNQQLQPNQSLHLQQHNQSQINIPILGTQPLPPQPHNHLQPDLNVRISPLFIYTFYVIFKYLILPLEQFCPSLSNCIFCATTE